MQSARLTLQDCSVIGNKGAGLDASGSSAVTVSSEETLCYETSHAWKCALHCHEKSVCRCHRWWSSKNGQQRVIVGFVLIAEYDVQAGCSPEMWAASWRGTLRHFTCGNAASRAACGRRCSQTALHRQASRCLSSLQTARCIHVLIPKVCSVPCLHQWRR